MSKTGQPSWLVNREVTRMIYEQGELDGSLAQVAFWEGNKWNSIGHSVKKRAPIAKTWELIDGRRKNLIY